jgi:hypothetical protein
MGIVVRLPARHVRASTKATLRTGLRACRSASLSSETPLIPRLLAERTSGAQNSAGMRLRSNHLATVHKLAPVSAIIVARDGQSSSNDRGVSVMNPDLGQTVLPVKAKKSYDIENVIRQSLGMADRMSETEEKLAFIGRVRAARMARFDTQKPMLTILGLDQGTYKQYEKRTPLPWRFIPKFCAATGVEIEWLLTGEGRGPAVEPLPSPRKREQKTAKRRAA